MPKIFTNNKYWLRSGHMNQKRHFDMTEDEKANVATCSGIKENHVCKNPVFRCIECGNFGCDQDYVDKCVAQGFKNDKCLHCGLVGTRMPILKDELAKYIEEWEKEVPIIH